MEARSHALLILSFIACFRSGPPRGGRGGDRRLEGEEEVEESDGLGGGGVGEWGDTEKFEFSLCCFLACGAPSACRSLIGCRPCGLRQAAWAVCETGSHCSTGGW